MKPELIKAIAVTAELTGTQLSEAAARVFSEDLARFPLEQVLAALTRCRREVKGRLVLADVLSRIDDGRPGVEEAWAMLPKNEADSAVLNDEIAEANAIAWPLIQQGDLIAARMAFKEAYQGIVLRARDEARPLKWWPSFGHEKTGRAKAIREAADRRRITNDKALRMLALVGPEYVEEHRLALEGPSAVALGNDSHAQDILALAKDIAPSKRA